MDESGAKRGRKPATGEPVLERAFRILMTFDAASPTLTLTEVSHRTGIPMSSALRLSRQLVSLGALERNDDGTFSIGLRLLETGSLAPRGHGLRSIAMPLMEDLHQATRNHVMLAVRVGREAMIVERLSARGAAPLMFRVGERIPLHSTGVGLALLAFSDHQFQEKILAGPLEPPAESSPVSAPELRRILADVRKEGAAVNVRAVPQPAFSVAAPILGADNQVIGSLAVLAPMGSLNPQSLKPAVIAVARVISRESAAIVGDR